MSISGINVVVAAETSALINFTTSDPAHTYLEYGTTVSYGSSTVDDPVRFYTEHAIPITGLSANTLYHYRIVATGSSVESSPDQTFTTATSGVNNPGLPIRVDTRMPDMAGATEKTVKNSGGHFTPSQFQAALDEAAAANGKRIITVDAGLTLSAGNYTLGVKPDNNWIVVRSSAHASLAEGRRITPSDTSSLFKIETSNTTAPLATSGAAHHWRFIGAEITIQPGALADAPGGFSQGGLVRIGTGAETAESQWSHDVIIDRCYVHGQPLKNTTRGVYNNGTDNAVIDSYLSEFHDTGNDSQAILHGEGRRLKIVNNYLEAAGENFMSGGVGHTVVPVTTPSDFEFTHNYLAWKQSWKTNDPSWDGKDWVTKNLFEIKTGKRFLVFAIVLDKWWSSEQTGGSIALKSSDNDKDPSVVCSDVVWYKSWGKNLGTGISINGSFWPDEESTDYTRRIWFIHDLWEINGDIWDEEDTGNPSEAKVSRIGPSVVDEGGGVFRKQYPDDFRIIHNTFTNANFASTDRSIHTFGEIPTANGKSENFVFKDNICGYNLFGIKCDGTAEGTASLDAITNSATRTWDYNLIAGSSTDYPAANNSYVANFTAVKFVNMGTGLGGNYRLASDSPGKNTASDGTDRGVDVDALERATESTIDGDWPTVGTSNVTVSNVRLFIEVR